MVGQTHQPGDNVSRERNHCVRRERERELERERERERERASRCVVVYSLPMLLAVGRS